MKLTFNLLVLRLWSYFHPTRLARCLQPELFYSVVGQSILFPCFQSYRHWWYVLIDQKLSKGVSSKQSQGKWTHKLLLMALHAQHRTRPGCALQLPPRQGITRLQPQGYSYSHTNYPWRRSLHLDSNSSECLRIEVGPSAGTCWAMNTY